MLKQFFQLVTEGLANAEREFFRASRTPLKESGVLYAPAVLFVHLAAGVKYIFLNFLLLFVELLILIFLPSEEGHKIIAESKMSGYQTAIEDKEDYQKKQKKVRRWTSWTFGTAVAAVAIVSLVLNLVVPLAPSSLGATYTFSQTNWGGGSSSNNAIHPTNQSAWSQYSSASSEITAVNGGEDLKLVSYNASSTQTTDTDFNAGTFSSATTTGSGSSASVKLSKVLHINEYTIGALSNVAVTASSVTTNSNGTWTIAFSGTPALSRIFKNDKFTDSASKAWKVLSVAPSVYKIIVVDSEGNTPVVSAPATGSGTVGRWYASISAWEAGRQGDITAAGRNSIERGLPYYDGAPDTTAVSIDGWTTDATHYIEIYVPLSERHRGKWDDNRYRLSVNSYFGAILNQEANVRVSGLQIETTTIGGSDPNSGWYQITASVDAGAIIIENNIIRSTGTTANASNSGIYWAPGAPTTGNWDVKIINNIIYNFYKGIYISNSGTSSGEKHTVYNNTLIGGTKGVQGIDASAYGASDTGRFYNNIIQGFSGNHWSLASSYATYATGNNITGDATSPDVSYRSKTVLFTDSAGSNYHLEFRDGTTNPARDSGTDLSGDSTYSFATDIDGDKRSGTWDIGADDVGAMLVMTYSIGTASRDFSTLQAWEDARDGNLTTRKVFKISGQSAAFTASETITGLTSNATSTYVPERASPSASETYMSLDGGSGTFQQGEVVQGGTSNATATISAILTTAGVIEKGEAYNDSTFTAGFTIDNSTTDATHYMWLTAEPRSRHTGVAGTGVRISGNIQVITRDSYSIIEWMEIDHTGVGASFILVADSTSYGIIIRNNIIHGTDTAGSRGISIGDPTGSNMLIYNNIIYNFDTGAAIYGTNFYNNVLISNVAAGIYRLNGTPLIMNNISVSNVTDFNVNGGSWNNSSSNNISLDAAAPGTGSLTNQATSSVRFVSTAPDFIDLHIMDGSVAKDAGADLSATFKGDIDGAQDRSGSWDIGVDEWFSSSPVYNSSGTFISPTIDFGAAINPSSLTWNPSTQSLAGTILKFQLATNNDNATWNYIGQDGATTTYFTISGSSTPSSLNSSRYLRYKAYLSTADSAFSPQLDDLTINYSYYATNSPSLISSPYNSNDTTNILGKIAWTATTTSGTEVRVQVRSAPNSGGVPGTWSSWCGYSACNDTDYFATSTNNVDLGSGHPLKNGGDDQWLQYKAIFVSNGASTPTLGSITLTYVVNAPPGLQNVTASQQTSDGKVAISYEVRDTDTASGTATRGYITPSFSYSTDGGQNWTNITSGYLRAGELSNKQVCDGTGTYGLNCPSTQYTQYTALWDAKSQLSGTYATNTKIMISATDNEGANNSASLASSVFALDVKNPVVAMMVDGTKDGQAGAIATSVTENSSAQMMLSNRSDYAADGLNGSSGSWIATSTSLTWNFVAGDPVRVYAKVRDGYQNETTAAPDAPNTPATVTIQDTSNLNLSEFREFVSWSVNAAGDFGSYKVYRSTDGTNYSLLSTIASAATNFLTDGSSGAWLSNGTTYYYKIVALDSSNNISRYSSAVSDIPDGQGGTDVTPPTITGLSSSAVNTTQATITWTTDELSNGTVYYSTDSSYSGSSTVSSMVTAHSVTLTGLTPNTAYNFRVRSTDPLGNVSSYATGTPFTTAQGAVISGVTVVSASGNSAEIVWNTNANSDSWVIYSANSDLSGSQTTGTSTPVGGAGPNYEHRVSLSGLNTNARYYFKVRSVDSASNAAENNNGGAYYTFSTAQDVTPPVISSVSVALASQTSAVVSWTTNESSDSQVIYGLGPSSLTSQTSVNSTMTINHSMILSGLTAGATYYYKVVSADSSANSSQSSVYNFNTTALALQETLVVTRYVEGNPPPDKTSPLITEVKVDGVTESEATVTWRTDEDADSFVEYGPPDILGATRGQRESVKLHRVILMDLRPNARYSFKATSADASGNISKSLALDFKTLSQQTAAKQIENQIKESIQEKIEKFPIENLNDIERLTKEIEQVLAEASAKVAPPKITGAEPKVEVSASFATISWATDRPANSIVAYAGDGDYKPNSDEPYLSTVGDPDEQVTEHKVTLSNLSPGMTYHFQVRSKGLIGGIGKSIDFNFKTGEEATISGIEIKDITKDSATIFWRTNLPATTLLEYGRSVDYGQTQTDASMNTSHTVLLRGMQAGTMYHFRAGGIDKNNKSFFSPDLNFVTEALPSLLNVKIDSVKEREMTVTWFTDVLSDSTVEYTNGITKKTEANSDKQLVKNHTMTITGLDENAPYSFKVMSKDEKGNEVKSSEYNLQTAKDVQPPAISNIQTQSAVSSRDKVQTIVSWRTIEPATSRVVYQEGAAINPAMEKSSPLNSDFKTNHVVVFTNFKSGSVYRLRIESVDGSGNISSSKDIIILTPQKQETVIDLIIKNFQDVFKWTEKIK